MASGAVIVSVVVVADSVNPVVLVLMALDYPTGTWTMASLVVIVPLLVAGWYLMRHRRAEAAVVKFQAEQEPA